MKKARTAPVKLVSGWKEIAAYLGKGVRTVQRYESMLGLPVRHPTGIASGSVIATKVELDAWVAASPFRESLMLTQIDRDRSHALRELRMLTAETRRLRSETVRLRKALFSAVEMLQSNLRAALTGRDETSPNHESVLSAPERRLLANVLTFESAKKRVI